MSKRLLAPEINTASSNTTYASNQFNITDILTVSIVSSYDEDQETDESIDKSIEEIFFDGFDGD